MTGRTHDLAAFTSLSFVVASYQISHVSLATAIVALGANLVGGLAPDLDQPTSELWQKIPVGSLLGRLVHPLFGSHRYISHSLVGIFLFGFFLNLLLRVMHSVLLVDMQVVWWAFMIGFISHVIADTFTKEGVPWLFPIPIKFGIPPFKFMRVKTGGIVEKAFVFPGLLLITALIFYTNYHTFLAFLKSLVK